MTALPHPQPNPALRPRFVPEGVSPGALSPLFCPVFCPQGLCHPFSPVFCPQALCHPFSPVFCPWGLCHPFSQGPLALQGTLGLTSPSMTFQVERDEGSSATIITTMEVNRAKITSRDRPWGNSPSPPPCLPLPSLQQGSGWGQIPDPGSAHLHCRWKTEAEPSLAAGKGESGWAQQLSSHPGRPGGRWSPGTAPGGGRAVARPTPACDNRGRERAERRCK